MLDFIARRPQSGGILVGLAIGLPHLFLPLNLSLVVAAMTLVFIAGIYVGFAIDHAHEHSFLSEVAVAVSFSAIALAGVFVWHWLIPIGLFGHAVWDFLHHRKMHFLSEIPSWYVPFCILVDVSLAAVLAVAWLIF